MFWLFLLVIGAVFLIYARLTNFALAMVGTLLLGFSNAPIDIAVGPLILHVTPRKYIGRVMAVITPANSLASLVSVTLAGILASTALHGFHATFLGLTFGPIDAIFTGTGLLILIGGVYAMLNLRQVRLAGEDTPAAAPMEVAAAGEEDAR